MPLILNGTTGISGVDGSAGTPSYQGTDTNTGIFYPAADTIAFAEGGAEIARFDSSGNLGIGTSSPNERLMVAGAIRATSNATNFATSDGALIDYFSGDMRIVAARSGANSSNMTFTTYSSGTPGERMRITASGNVAIGSSSSNDYRLTVIPLATYGNAEDGNISIASSPSGGTATSPTTVGGIVFGNQNVTNSYAGRLAVIQDNPVSSTATHMRFYTNNGTGNSGTLERMRIDSAGRVTTPFQPGFRVGLQGSTPSIAVNALWRFDTTSGNGRFNTGGHYNTSTYTFTAPIAGTYYFHMQIITEGTVNNTARTDMVVLRINGGIAAYSERRGYYVANTTGDNGFYVDNVTAILQLSAGDTVNGVNASPSAATQHANVNYSIFEGYLLG